MKHLWRFLAGAFAVGLVGSICILVVLHPAFSMVLVLLVAIYLVGLGLLEGF